MSKFLKSTDKWVPIPMDVLAKPIPLKKYVIINNLGIRLKQDKNFVHLVLQNYYQCSPVKLNTFSPSDFVSNDYFKILHNIAHQPEATAHILSRMLIKSMKK